MSPPRSGLACALGAYLLWGVLPVYWKLLQRLGALEILAHRIVWSVVFLVALVILRRDGGQLRGAFSQPRTLPLQATAALLLAVNWGAYIWGVNAGQIVETSLGYYINPLVNVVLATAFLHERLRRAQWFAVALAAGGVIHLTLYYGKVPWLALVLAVSFGCYGLAKKMTALGAVTGLALETAVLAPLALAYLGWLGARGEGALGHASPGVTSLLLGAGVVTSLPLLLFARAAQTVPLSTLGLMQYLSPSCGLLLGVLAYGEPFPRGRALGFALVWGALALYAAEGLLRARRRA